MNQSLYETGFRTGMLDAFLRLKPLRLSQINEHFEGYWDGYQRRWDIQEKLNQKEY